MEYIPIGEIPLMIMGLVALFYLIRSRGKVTDKPGPEVK